MAPYRRPAAPDSTDLLIDALAARVAEKAVGTTPATTWAHGPGGLLSTPGLDPNIVNAMPLPLGALEAELPVHMSNDTNPVYGILTGQTADVGSEPTTACALGPVAGNLKLCQQTWTFGRQTMASSTIDITRAGERVNRGEFLDHRLVGNPFAALPQIAGQTAGALARSEAEKALFEMTAGWFRRYAHLVFDGNPANTTGSAGYIEAPGLDMIINTGYVDSVTGVACPRADSLVAAYDLNMMTGTNGAALVALIAAAVRNRRYFAKRVGLGDVEHVLVMRYGLFYALTGIWPCAYNLTGCVLPSGSQQFIDAGDQIRMRDDMRRRRVLPMDDGQEIRVIIDDSVAEAYDSEDALYTSDIYLVPLRGGGIDLTFLDYFNWNGPGAALEVARLLAPNDFFRTSTDGRFLVTKQAPNGWCIQAGIIARRRIVCHAPFLAARITGVSYSMLYHEISPFIGSQGYANGGNTGYALVPDFVSPVE